MEDRSRIGKQGSTALAAIRQLRESLEEWDPVDRKIADEQTTLAKALVEHNQEWESIQSSRRKEEEEWKRQEEKIEQMREALRAHNLQSSRFVKQFLREKNLPNNLGDQEVEGYLREDMVNKEIGRSRQLRSYYQKLQEYQRDVRQLETQSKQWKELVKRRVKDRKKVVNTLKELGLKQERFEALVSQLKELTRTLKEYTSLMENCKSATKEREIYIRECEKQLSKFWSSLDSAIGGINSEILNLRSSIEQVKKEIKQINMALRPRVATSATGGGALGAVVGTLLFPGPGTIIGTALVGALGGGFAGALLTDVQVSLKKSKLRGLEEELEGKERRLERCEKRVTNVVEELTEIGKLELF